MKVRQRFRSVVKATMILCAAVVATVQVHAWTWKYCTTQDGGEQAGASCSGLTIAPCGAAGVCNTDYDVFVCVRPTGWCDGPTCEDLPEIVSDTDSCMFIISCFCDGV